MGRRLREIKAEVIWETTDDPNAILPWVRATELLLKAKARRDARLAAEQKEDLMAAMIESLLRFAHDQQDVLLSTQARGVLFHVSRSGTGLIYTLEKTQRERPEPASALAKVLARFVKTKSLRPADYQDVTFNASYTLALLKLFMAAQKQS